MDRNSLIKYLRSKGYEVTNETGEYIQLIKSLSEIQQITREVIIKNDDIVYMADMLKWRDSINIIESRAYKLANLILMTTSDTDAKLCVINEIEV